MAADGPKAGSVSATHPEIVRLPLVVAASVDDALNRLGVRPRPRACWRIEGMRFDFGSSVILPEAEDDLSDLAALWHRTGGPPVSVFAHADPVGDDEFNKTLAGRRARSLYALLVRDVDKWDELHNTPWPDDDWNTRALGIMRARVGANAPSERKALFAAYMDAICHEPDGTPFRLQKTDFLGGGEDAGGKADYQGCSEFNPVVVFSKDEDQTYKDPSLKEERNADNAPNRRVLVFLFPVGTRVPPGSWPCPRASEASAGCRAQLWPDADTRRNPQEARRTYDRERNTFACAFYDEMARLSPCEKMRRTLRIRLFNPEGAAMANAPYRLTVVATNDVRTGTAGQFNGEEAWIVEPAVLAPSRVLVEWGDATQPKPVPLKYRTLLFVDLREDQDDEATWRRRLANLSYTDTDLLEDALRAFQRDYELDENGQLDERTKQALLAAVDEARTKDQIEQGG